MKDKNSSKEVIEKNDFDKSRAEYEQAIKNGSIEAKIGLAVLYWLNPSFEGGGIIAVDLFQSVIMDKNASIKCIALACHNLSTLYLSGASGVERNEQKASEFSFKAKEHGFPQ